MHHCRLRDLLIVFCIIASAPTRAQENITLYNSGWVVDVLPEGFGITLVEFSHYTSLSGAGGTIYLDHPDILALGSAEDQALVNHFRRGTEAKYGIRLRWGTPITQGRLTTGELTGARIECDGTTIWTEYNDAHAGADDTLIEDLDDDGQLHLQTLTISAGGTELRAEDGHLVATLSGGALQHPFGC